MYTILGVLSEHVVLCLSGGYVPSMVIIARVLSRILSVGGGKLCKALSREIRDGLLKKILGPLK